MRLALGSFAAALLLSTAAMAADGHWQRTAAHVAAAVDEVEAKFGAGDHAAARQALTEAYFGRFEDSKMEGAVRKEISADRAVEVEGMFGDLRKAIKAKDGVAVRRLATGLRAALAEDGKVLDAAGVSPDVYEVNR